MKALKTLTAASALVLTSQATLAGDVVINLGYAAAEGSSYAVLANKFEELAEEYSGGSIDVKVRCCGQLMGEDEAFKAMQLGTVDMHIITGNNISPHFPLMDAFVLPYIFEDKSHAYRVLEGEVGQGFAKKLHEATNVHLLTFGFVGDRDFYNSRQPITEMADMAGLKVRVPKNQVMIDTFTEFGAAPIPLPWADTPTALQTGTVEGADNGTSFIKSQKFYEIMPHFTVLEHFTYFSPLFASDRIMGKLDDDQRDAVMRAARDAGIFQKEEMTRQVDEIRAFLTGEGGMKTAEFDRTDFIAAGQRVQDNYSADKGDDFKALVAEIRAAAE
ncbi:tripartite ATP-independent transporter solute receptor, DctP family [Ruegeria halocynthiae]|uniref:Tripartite ATP-independent transporter solute receptor, DctP family n=1 Tax=Ruegeria halocynthiae TaxID=985054 RepID=A0A1H3F622_9RHOB|nr:TRAP transporter substrate-binding protein [Ruegeria halocynthiae]SDX86355.1 tripartite ATP-independent transporter solute receptor, DctP family [Ruegeria halocynthiae]